MMVMSFRASAITTAPLCHYSSSSSWQVG